MKGKPQSELHARVAATLRRHAMASPGTRLGVGVSGGADSVALLLLLHDLREELGITLLALHFNHQLRGAEADGDEQSVAGLAAQLGIEFQAGREDVVAVAEREGWNLEDAARRLRHAFFDRAVAVGRVNRVATGHTMDDQAETVLAHLLRGTGITGLAGIYPVAGHVVRPVLEVRRAELREFLAERKQSWREDATNQDTARLRARIRQRLLPLLEQEFQPAAVERLARLAAHARREEEFWSALWEQRLRTVERSDALISVPVRELLDPLRLLPLQQAAPNLVRTEAPARRFVRRLYETLTGSLRGLTAEHVQQVLELAASPEGGRRIELPRRVVVERALGGRLVFTLPAARTARAAQTYQYVVAWNGTGSAQVEVPEIGQRLRLDGIDWPPMARDTSMQAANALDASRVVPPLMLRNWRPGDAYRPKGRKREHKLKRLFWEQGVPAGERASWPVLLAGERVVWARGFGVAEGAAAGEKTRRAIVIREEKI